MDKAQCPNGGYSNTPRTTNPADNRPSSSIKVTAGLSANLFGSYFMYKMSAQLAQVNNRLVKQNTNDKACKKGTVPHAAVAHVCIYHDQPGNHARISLINPQPTPILPSPRAMLFGTKKKHALCRSRSRRRNSDNSSIGWQTFCYS